MYIIIYNIYLWHFRIQLGTERDKLITDIVINLLVFFSPLGQFIGTHSDSTSFRDHRAVLQNWKKSWFMTQIIHGQRNVVSGSVHKICEHDNLVIVNKYKPDVVHASSEYKQLVASLRAGFVDVRLPLLVFISLIINPLFK